MRSPDMQLRRSLLFVPGNRPERFDKAATSGADLFCIDLEDAVPEEGKSQARQAALGYLAGDAARGTLRINAVNTPDGLQDLLALRQAKRLPKALLLPKLRFPQEAQLVRELLGSRHQQISLFALIETPQGIANAAAIAAEPAVDCLLFGSADWAAETGAVPSWDSLLLARSLLVQAAAQAGIDAMDGPWLDLEDEAGLRAETTQIARLGFAGKILIHPRQIEPAHHSFRPPEDAIARAKAIVTAFEAAGGALMVAGRMVDEPVYRAARRTLAAASQDA